MYSAEKKSASNTSEPYLQENIFFFKLAKMLLQNCEFVEK